jgi:asparagine synthase (glutamine-hydrolysing)
LGFFFLSRDDAPAPGKAWWRAHERHGFDRIVEFAPAGWRLWVAGKLNGLGPHCVRRENGEFAACTGIFFYRGRRFEAGLELLLDEFDNRTFPWAECRGHYAAILFKAGKLWVASDELGAYKLYRDEAGTRLSSSFSALRASCPSARPDPQGVYEYAFNGATYGDKTFVREVRQQRHGCLFALSDTAQVVSTAPVIDAAAAPPPSLDAAAEEYAGRLRALFRIYAAGGGRFHTALSGGYDSRLMLALLLDAGLDPTLYVYGDEGDDDVRVAKAVAAGEGLALDHVDKDQQGVPASRRGWATERAWARFDAWKNAGLFDNGADAEDRLQRAPFDVSVLNGSVGESFRNFFYLPDGPYRPEEIVWSFYWRIDPAELTERFDAGAYTNAMAEDMRRALPGAPQAPKLDRFLVEALYPLHRARYWTGRDTGLNQRFGPLLFPFMEPRVIAGTERIPIAWKDYGRLESRIIERIYPRLAKYPTAYGFAPADGPPATYRFKMQFSLRRPTWLRRYSYLVQRRRRAALVPPDWLRESIAAAGLDPTLPAMSEFFRIDRIRGLDLYNRVATMELALEGAPPESA